MWGAFHVCAKPVADGVVAVTTQPGSLSQRNAQRVGFELLYTWANLVRQP